MRVGIDIGGTFTDLVATTDDGVFVAKVSSTPSDPAEAFAAALRAAGDQPDEVLHGTTVATNAVLTRTGARLGFVSTSGFEHLLQLARQDRPSLYDLKARRTPPVVERPMCAGVAERIDHRGRVVDALDESAARDAIASLRGVEGVVVTLLHSYANDAHERLMRDVIRDVLGDVSVSLSSEVLPEIREYERASTTALDAYVQPVVGRYLDRVARSSPSRVGVMWSGGGVRSVAQTIERPIHTMYSGPAAGVLGAIWAGNACGVRDLVTLDMGGTSADVSLVEGGRADVADESSIDGLPFRTPSLDVVSVGAGGGSIAWVDEGGALRVGPASAGADPGPAGYGRGGTEATVTDAQIVLGQLGGSGLAGGEVELDREAAASAVRRIATRAGLETEVAAEGILRVVRATMSRAIRSVSVERGKDVRDFTLVAFGGAGPLHATAVARELGIGSALVPPAPGVLAALGLLVASRRADASLSRPMRLDRARDVELRSILHELTEKVLAEIAGEGVTFAQARIEHFVDCRYEGQSHELRIPVEGGPSFALIAEAFQSAHRERYGFDRRGVAIEAVTFRAAASGPPGEVTMTVPTANRTPHPVSTQRVASEDAPVFDRAELPRDFVLQGPALITELDSTTWIDRDAHATVHESGSLLIEVR